MATQTIGRPIIYREAPLDPILPWAYSRKRSIIVAVLSDLHSGSSYAPWDPRYELRSPGSPQSARTIGLTPLQRQLESSWKRFLTWTATLRPNILLLGGDLVDGSNRHGYGYETIPTNIDDQADCLIPRLEKLLKACARGCSVYGVRGSGYHSEQYNDVEKYIVESLGGKYCGVAARLRIAGHRILLTHKISNAQFYLEQAAGRTVWLLKLAESDEKLNHDIEVVFTAHLHTYLHLVREWRSNVDKHIVFAPGWQAQTPFIVTKVSSGAVRLPTIGAVYAVFQEDLPPWIHCVQYPTPVEDEEEIEETANG
jgi:hypothetical protein